MTSNWKEYKIEEITDILGDGLHGTPIYTENGEYAFVNGNNLVNGHIEIKTDTKRVSESEFIKYKKPLSDRTLLVSINGTLGNVAEYNNEKIILGKSACYFNLKNNVSKSFIKYVLLSKTFQNYLENNATGTTIKNISLKQMREYKFLLPPIETQQKIAKVLSAIDDKIELNNSINKNLEQQAQAVFVNMFSEHIENLENENTKTLSELVTNIDNRGKTPPLSVEKTNYPIIDVRALSGDTRIINYNNCTKYVTEDTYNNWFRSGHPQKYDILLSTVGSLAEMKLFLGNIGCIAQNVVGYRCKISPLYMYQYLSHIKKDLLAYDIGSVQPSIKVTHIAKHPIYIPQDNELKQFHEIAEAITNEIYLNSLENERLTQLRDTLLPKLMNGEIDVDKVEV